MDILNEFAKVNCHVIECQDGFTRTAQHQMNDLGWSPQMSQFMTPMLKMESKIEDLRKAIDVVVQNVRLSVTFMKKIEVALLGIAELRSIRKYFEEIKVILNACTGTKLLALKNYRRKVLRMVARVRQEEKGYLAPQEKSAKIMDPSLSLDVIQDFIHTGLLTAFTAGALNNEYVKICESFVATRLKFCTDAKKRIGVLSAMADTREAMRVKAGKVIPMIVQCKFKRMGPVSKMESMNPWTRNSSSNSNNQQNNIENA